MPKLPPKPCNRPGCKETVTTGGYCEAHLKRRNKSKHKEYDRNRPSAAKRGYGRNHQKMRKMMLARQPLCQAEACSKPSIDMDHIDGNTMNVSMDNLQMLCRKCHNIKTRRDTTRKQRYYD